ncbi:NPC intracellular cholesterol transporter 2 homolog a isoform X1 [Anopheles gambiae]|uniref:NPC intracellular cholesterol transporter 2 homolog a isoform X1 n=1 Tax=Anopheles gambiae TaxID=7165 RepID=UPI002AC96D46|nr:NPC intracellular cholesterol transporter 2 homolog a isoform X1 [Anopheles gambiae]
MTNKSAAAFLLVGAVCLTLMPTLTSAAEFANCANETAIGKYTQVEVSNCADSDNSCVLKRNSNATISITFTSGEDLSELKAVVHGIILGMEVPFKLPNDDGCKDSGLECPLTKDTSYRYSTTLPVLKQYPKVRNLLMERFFLRSRGGNLQTKSFPAAKCALIARIIISFNGFFSITKPNSIIERNVFFWLVASLTHRTVAKQICFF